MKPAESVRLWQRVWEVYAGCLRESPGAAACVKSLNITDGRVLEHFRAGYSDGTLPRLLPATGDLQDTLRASGLLNAVGEEALCGCLVVPVFTGGAVINGFWGVKPGAGSEPEERIVAGEPAGLVRGTLIKGEARLFVTSRVLDAFGLWCAGFTNVVVVPGAAACPAELEQLIAEDDYREIYLCPSDGGLGALAAEVVQKPLVEGGVAWVAQVQWPAGIRGARGFFPAHRAEDFEALLPKPARPTEPTKGVAGRSVTGRLDGLDICLDGRLYVLRAIQKPGPSRLKATVRAVADRGRFVVETVDLYCSRSRRGFVAESARLFRQSLEIIQEDFSILTLELERYVREHDQEGPTKPWVLGEDERAEGLKLGRAPDLIGEIVGDLERLGVVGEDTNKLLAYLVMTSRKLPEPLALLTVSGSGAGKSHLQDMVLALCPEEDLVKLTSLTDQALFYRGENSLRQKVLAIEELAGAEGADYAIRNLLSAKKLVVEATVRNPLTGRLETQVNTVYGPTAVFQTTSSPHTNGETRSRFILVSVDESPAQTRAILQRQRQAHTLAGWHRRQNRELIRRRHHAFQRLLRPIPVINAFEPLLSYPDEHLLARRDHSKYLDLILAVAFLHQMQRPARHDPDLGDYVEATLDDVAIANEIAHQVFGNSVADLSQPGRELLSLLEEFMREKGAGAGDDKDTFSRRELREAIRWGDTRLRVHLRELVELEYVVPLNGRFGVAYHYRLLAHGGQEDGRFLGGLKSVEQLRCDARLAGVSCHLAATSQAQNREGAGGLTGGSAASCEDFRQTSHPVSREQVLAPTSGV